MNSSLQTPTAKISIFILEGLNAFTTTLYAYYLFFYMTQEFGFDRKSNLILSAAHGLVFTFAAWFGGHYAERKGWAIALLTAIAIMMITLLLSLKATESWQVITLFLLWTAGVSITWPTLESMISRGASVNHLATNLGIYNIVWSASAAIAFFVGGALMKFFGPKTIFWIPLILHTAQLIALYRLKRQSIAKPVAKPPGETETPDLTPSFNYPHRPIVRARFFLHLAWLSNPFSYIAINTLIPMIPSFAAQLNLDTSMTGVICSIWLFSRMFTFLFLWKKTSWYYQFNWFLLAFSLLIFCFLGMLVSGQILLLILFQIGFGYAIGYLYYSSLLYSMFSGEGSSSLSGIHEASIGVGIFLGPAVSASALHFVPLLNNAGIYAATLILVSGFVGSLGMRYRFNKKETYDESLFKP